jgi:hypothetical protein
MVIIRTSATEVKTHAVSPEFPVHFSVTDAEQLGGAAGAAAAGAAGAAGAATGAAGAAAGDAGAAAGGLVCAEVTAGAAKPIRTAAASTGARRERERINFIGLRLQNSEWEGIAVSQSASLSFSPVRIRTAESRL